MMLLQAYVIVFDDDQHVVAYDKIFKDEFRATRRMGTLKPGQYRVMKLEDLMVAREQKAEYHGYLEAMALYDNFDL